MHRSNRSKLNNIFNKKRTDYNWANYKKRNELLCEPAGWNQKRLFSEVKHKGFKRKLWKTIKQYFTNKWLNSNKRLLKEKLNLASNEKQLVTIMNSFFINATKSLKLKEDNESNANTLKDVVNAFNSYSSIARIRRVV